MSKKKVKWQVPKQTNENGKRGYCLEGETKERFFNLFPNHFNKDLAKWFGLSLSTIVRIQQRYGLKKNHKRINAKRTKLMVKKLEANGYYESKRGIPPSQACIDAAKKLREGGFNPMQRLKEKNPQKYKETIRKQSETRHLKHERDKRRVLYGLPPLTGYKIVLNPLGSAASTQKHEMIKYNNYFPDPDHPNWVCYDAETKRSARREATAKRHGLKIVEGE